MGTDKTKMKNLTYYNIKKLPEEMISEVHKSLENTNIYPLKCDHYKACMGTYTLQNFVQSLFDTDILVLCHVIYDNLEIHKDVHRTIAYNYIIESGGSLVKTNFYNDNKELKETYYIEPYKWHSLNVSLYHSVTNIERPRIAITCFPAEEVPEKYKT